MSLLMDALKRAEMVKDNAQDEIEDSEAIAPQNEFDPLADEATVLSEDNQLEATLAETESKADELTEDSPRFADIADITDKDWEEGLLFDLDDAPITETITPPATISEDVILSELDKTLAQEISQVSTPIEEGPSDTIDREEDLTQIPIDNENLKLIDWVDELIDEEALHATAIKKKEVPLPVEPVNNINEVAPHTAKRLLDAESKPPQTRKNLLLFGLLGLLIMGGGALYLYDATTTTHISFNKRNTIPSEIRENTNANNAMANSPRETKTNVIEPASINQTTSSDSVESNTTQPITSSETITDQSVDEQKTVTQTMPPPEPPAINPPKTTEATAFPLPKLGAQPTLMNKEKQSIFEKYMDFSKNALPDESKVVKAVKEQEPLPVQTDRGIHILRKTIEPYDNTQLSTAYNAFQRNDIKTAQRIYTQILQTEPANRDALLGLAGIALQQGHTKKAQYYYQQVLQLYPQDKSGQVGLVNALGQGSPTHSESRLKLLLKESPQASHIHFSLGNLYARQGRWTQAQQAYFSAYRYNANHPDYAYNLAVSLDQINQSKLALTYYQKALQLTQKRGVAYHFSPQAIRQRIQTLTTYYQTH